MNLALVPVALIPELKEYHIVSKFCIGADGIVDSVKLYHDVPLEEIDEVLLDYQSRSSVALVKVLFKFAWNKNPRFISATPGFEQQVSGKTAAVVIGDRTFALNGRYKYETDLAQAWKNFNGLPFVFAAWISTAKLPDAFTAAFNEVLGYGVTHIRQAVKDDYRAAFPDPAQITEYLENRIDYHLDEKKMEAMRRFHEYLSRL